MRLLVWGFHVFGGSIKVISRLRFIAQSKVLMVLFITAIPLFIYSNCSSSHSAGSYSATGTPIDTGAILNSLQDQSYAIRLNKCASCHGLGTSVSPLTDILSTSYLTQNNYVVPGSPQTSRLYLRVIDGLMPPEGSPALTETELDVMRDWIAAEGGNFDTYIGGTPIDTGGGGGGTPATFTQVRAILTQNCVNCHRAGGTLPRLDVDAATLRGNGLVIPNNASGSPLLMAFSSMPQGQPFGLNSTQANTVRSWINSGAN